MEREEGDGERGDGERGRGWREREVMEREEVYFVMNLVNFMLGRAVT